MMEERTSFGWLHLLVFVLPYAIAASNSHSFEKEIYNWPAASDLDIDNLDLTDVDYVSFHDEKPEDTLISWPRAARLDKESPEQAADVQWWHTYLSENTLVSNPPVSIHVPFQDVRMPSFRESSLIEGAFDEESIATSLRHNNLRENDRVCAEASLESVNICHDRNQMCCERGESSQNRTIHDVLECLNWSTEMPPEELAVAIDKADLGQYRKSTFTRSLIGWLENEGAEEWYVEAFKEKRRTMCVDRNQISRVIQQPSSELSESILRTKLDVVKKLKKLGIDFKGPVDVIENITRGVKVGYHSEATIRQAIQYYLKAYRSSADAALFRRLRKAHTDNGSASPKTRQEG